MTALSTSDGRLRHLFDPRGVIVVGASSHPGKFGFAALHNILAFAQAQPLVYLPTHDPKSAARLNEQRIVTRSG